MKNIMCATLLTTALLWPAVVPAQAEKPVAAKVKLEMAEPKAEGRRAGSRAERDARECLQLATNMEIHKCAEKYR
ncbi:MAG: hypothetical protein OEW79_03895 [Betaproteobacteria bacterium]|nr:hypothetical protein [Betaproteobacteria bacterium]MDH5341959.1 hypothetical protein [Betaproteobacteria bacterium]